MLNVQIENFKNQVYATINGSGLLIGTAYYVFKDIFRDLEKSYYETLKEEMKSVNEPKEETYTLDINDSLEDQYKQAQKQGQDGEEKITEFKVPIITEKE